MVRIKALFIGSDGVVHAENIPMNKRELEFMDGCHPMTPGTVFYDIDREGPPIYLVWHGRPSAEGDDDPKQEKAIIKEAVHLRQHTLKPPVSKRWFRLTIRGLVMLFKLIVISFILGFAGLMLMVVVP